MKKLMILCFAILFSSLAMLSFINYSYDGVEKIEGNKQRIIIEKPSDVTGEEFLRNIDMALQAIDSDIMYRFVDVSGDKVHYHYFKTGNTENFISLSGKYTNISLDSTAAVSTTRPDGYTIYHLNVSDMLQDITFYRWNNAAVYDLSSGTYYIENNSSSNIVSAISDLGYKVMIDSGAAISGKLPVILYAFIPICLMLMSMIFYVLSSGKKNVLCKMEGYRSLNIMQDEFRLNGKIFLITFSILELLKICLAVVVFEKATLPYIIFAIPYIIIGIVTFVIGLIAISILIFWQSGAEQIKGKRPQRGMYYITMIVKCAFLVVIVFFMTIAIRNVTTVYNTYEAARSIAEKVNGYVTFPIFINNSSDEGLEENFLEFYKMTVDEYDGILISASNYETDIISGKTLYESFGQEDIVINRNYLSFNPIYDTGGEPINLGEAIGGQIYVLIPETKIEDMEKHRKTIEFGYDREVDFIVYDGENSAIYSYNANVAGDSYGLIEQPIIIVEETDDLESSYVLSYISKGEYFIKPRTDNPYLELSPLFREAGIDVFMQQTPYILSNFDETINHQFEMLILYGANTLVLSIGLICQIVFSAKLYCVNYRKKIACFLVEGYPLLHCIKQHLIVTIITYILSWTMVSLLGGIMHVGMNYYILIIAFVLEYTSIFAISRGYMKKNLNELVKGAE